eukprot:7647004-Pyramimonas_sp.AAC.1
MPTVNEPRVTEQLHQNDSTRAAEDIKPHAHGNQQNRGDKAMPKDQGEKWQQEDAREENKRALRMATC